MERSERTAFVSANSWHGLVTQRSSLRTHNKTVRRCPSRRFARSVRMTGNSGPGERKAADDDDQLQQELRMRVQELYGSRDNIAIETNGAGDTVDFRVIGGPRGPDLTSYRSAWFTIASIVGLAFLAGVLFTGLYYKGAVHLDTKEPRRYAMPTLNTASYVEPYELLEEESADMESY